MIQILKSIVNFFIFILVLLLIFSCGIKKTERPFTVILEKNSKKFLLNINQRKELKVILPDERRENMLSIKSLDPSIAEVESNNTRVILGRKEGITKLLILYEDKFTNEFKDSNGKEIYVDTIEKKEIIVEVEVIDPNIKINENKDKL